LPLILNYPFQNTDDLLVIRGDKSTEELQRGLMAGSREFTELTVYTTSSRPTLDEDVEMLRSSLQEGDPIWLVFFSPSSAEMVLRSMDSAARAKEGDGRSKGSHGDGGIFEGVERESRKDCGHNFWSSIRVAAIGETTAKYLAGRNINVDAVAKEPTAQGLAEAIRHYEEDQRNTT
jgi:uroporphyrinogen-III synthase